MSAKTKFEVRRRYPGDPMSRVLDVACVRGTAVGPGADKDTAILASGTKFLGFVTRDVVAGGPTLANLVIPTDLLALPFTKGQEVGIEKADEVEAEGVNHLLTSGTGLINGSTAVGTKLSFDGLGRFYVAQTGDIVFFTLTANLTNVAGATVDEGAVRIVAEAVR